MVDSHPLAAKIKAWIDGLDHQPTFEEFVQKFKTNPLLVELMVISTYYLDFDPTAVVAENFAHSKDSERIEELMERYNGFSELEDMFIPKNAMAASLYKDHGEVEKAKELIDQLFTHQRDTYFNDLYTIRDLIIEGLINLEVPGCNLNNLNSLIPFLMDQIRERKTACLKGRESEINFEHFYFYKLNYLFSLLDTDNFLEKAAKYKEENQLSLMPVSNFSIYVNGEFLPSGVMFTINVKGLANLFHGFTTEVKVNLSLSTLAQNIGKNLLKDEVAGAVSDYLLDKIPMAQEVKLGKSILNAIVNSSMEMADISSFSKELYEHQKEMEALGVSVKEYYIQHFLAKEFKKFFDEQNIEYVEKEMKPIYERIYINFIQSINNLMTPEQEANASKGKKGSDEDTQKFLAVCDLIANNAARTQLKIKKKAKI
jgi:hypothetical protein